MERLTMTQFRKYYEAKPTISIVYNSADNRQLNNTGIAYPAPYQPLHTVLRFKDIAIMLCPDKICFKGDSGTLCLENVSEIQLEDNDFYDTVYIHCKNSDTVYTFIFE